MSDLQKSTLDLISHNIGKMSDYELGYFAGRAEEISKRNQKKDPENKKESGTGVST